jgi:hypothetical protein
VLVDHADHGTPPKLTVHLISEHLGVQPWSIARELKLPGENRLKGKKERGAGRVGQGGQWQVELTDYLDWLGVPDGDRPVEGLPRLPRLHDFIDVAAELGVAGPRRLADCLDLHRLPYLRVGEHYYLTDNQLAAVRRLSWDNTK